MMLFCRMPWEFFVEKASYQNKWNLSTNYENLLTTPNLRLQRQKVWRNPGRVYSRNVRCYNFLFYDLLVAPLESIFEWRRNLPDLLTRDEGRRQCVFCWIGFYWGLGRKSFSFIANLEASKAPTPPPKASLSFLSLFASQSCLFFSPL